MKWQVCTSPADYARCSDFQYEVEGTRDKLGYPCVLAENTDGTMRGFISTNSDYGVVLSGPMVIDPKYRPRLPFARDLVTLYHYALKEAGVTSYFFSVEKENTKMLEAVAGIGLTPYSEDVQRFWYKQTI